MTTADNLVYHVGDFKVDVIRRQVVTPEQTVNVRPKTFSLLLVFLQNPFLILQKEFLLNQVWDDVCVEEQVLVQSIRELRQLFAPVDVIQTHPRKGYAWVVPVAKAEKTSISPLKPLSYSRKKIVGVVASLLVLAILIAFTLVHNFSSSQMPKNVIAVLPVNNKLQGSNLAWVRLGVMDQIIQSLQLAQGTQVFDVPYMLNLLKISGKNETRRLELVRRIFEISGSSMVVDLELSGTVNDYRLVYRLFTRTDQSSGVIVEHQLDSLVEALAKIIAAKTESPLELAHLDAQFNSELMAQAVEKWNLGQGDAAISLLQTAVAIEPDNFLAHQLAIEYLLQQRRWLQAAGMAKAIIESAETAHFSRAYIFYFLLAQAELERGELQAADQYLDKAQLLAVAAFDLVYQGYIATLQGDLAIKEDNLALAEAAYQRAIGNHQSIACPLGVSLVRLKLIRLYSLQKKNALAMKESGLVNALIKKHGLPLQPLITPLI